MAFKAYNVTNTITGGLTGAVISFTFLIAGALFPDIDHHNSYAFRAFKTVIVSLTAFSILILELYNWNLLLEIGELLASHKLLVVDPEIFAGVIALLLVLVLTGTVAEVTVRAMPIHRGPIHDPIYNTIFAFIKLPFICWAFHLMHLSSPILMGIIATQSWLIGVLIHLTLDEVKL